MTETQERDDYQMNKYTFSFHNYMKLNMVSRRDFYFLLKNIKLLDSSGEEFFNKYKEIYVYDYNDYNDLFNILVKTKKALNFNKLYIK